MVDFYLKLVKAEKLDIDDVPKKYRDKVKEKMGEE